MILKNRIHFKLRPYGKNAAWQIQLHATFNGNRLVESTGCQLNAIEAWDEKEEVVKSGYKGPKGETALTLNNKLRLCREHMETVFKYFEVIDVLPTKKQVVDKYQERIHGSLAKKSRIVSTQDVLPQKKLSFWNYYDLFTKEVGEKNAWTVATFKKMAALKTDLMSFKSNLSFSSLTESTLTAFVAYLRDTKTLRTPRKKKGDREDYDPDDITGLKNSTIDKKLSYLRWFLKWATEKGYNTNNTYKSFRPTLKQTQRKVIYLTREEIARIRALDLSEDLLHLDPVRDVFLFCCFSGLRFSDANNLRKSDVKGDHIEITTVKTADSVSIELNNTTKAILEKYKEIPFAEGKALPTLTNQAMNRELKDLCRLAGINEEIRITTFKGSTRIDEVVPKWAKVGTHTGRRTFIVTALSLGIPPNVVMKWTGHSDYKSMQPYIDIVDAIKAESMAKFDKL